MDINQVKLLENNYEELRKISSKAQDTLSTLVSAFSQIDEDSKSVPTWEKIFIPGIKSPIERVE